MTEKARLTEGRLSAFECPADKQQAFLRDASTPGLSVRATPRGEKTKAVKSYVFERRLGGKTVRVTIGATETWSIKDAQAEARRLGTLVDQGLDPRIEKANAIASAEATHSAKRIEETKRELLARTAWEAYCEVGKAEGTSRGKAWSALHLRDHLALASKGGSAAKRGGRTTEPGPLAELLDEPLADLTSESLERWINAESKKRPTRASLAFRLLRAFINWCAEHPEYADIVNADSHRKRSIRKQVPPSNPKKDRLQRDQLRAWFEAVRRHGGATTSNYLQCLLLVGARPMELARLRMADVDFRWHSMTMRDKVEGTRRIPLTHFVAGLIKQIPREKGCPWVFPSADAVSGHITDPSDTHNRAVAEAGIGHLTLQGLRRSFASLSEWVEAPAGVRAQIQGHKPSATAEKYYIHRELDQLRVWHNRIEEWILREAGIGVEQSQGVSEGAAADIQMMRIRPASSP
ncbi:tyrosine-type recombinase/integrase [Roseateles oligotrophus]|uniref:Integrase family protein n=1 Tax=Roseateles oligotrophus TaxID=1769250 RepID=A0ABT2Y8H0_9BURK|nr:integrase family protein [Roseateles oligotrophus]MCV2366591.1 integrase family protein [Roseateles oligotrophus]